MGYRVGIDLIAVSTISQAIRDHGERYLRRVYTSGEISDCSSDGRVDPSRLAGRFAVKEATLKVLRAPHIGIAWTAIEVQRSSYGGVELALDGKAAEVAAAAQLTGFAVSLSHEADFAAAVVLVQEGGPADNGSRHA